MQESRAWAGGEPASQLSLAFDAVPFAILTCHLFPVLNWLNKGRGVVCLSATIRLPCNSRPFAGPTDVWPQATQRSVAGALQDHSSFPASSPSAQRTHRSPERYTHFTLPSHCPSTHSSQHNIQHQHIHTPVRRWQRIAAPQPCLSLQAAYAQLARGSQLQAATQRSAPAFQSAPDRLQKNILGFRSFCLRNLTSHSRLPQRHDHMRHS